MVTSRKWWHLKTLSPKNNFKPSEDFEGGLPHHEADWKFKYMKMESRYEEEKMACVYNIMEKNKLKKETED